MSASRHLPITAMGYSARILHPEMEGQTDKCPFPEVAIDSIAQVLEIPIAKAEPGRL